MEQRTHRPAEPHGHQDTRASEAEYEKPRAAEDFTNSFFFETKQLELYRCI